MSVQEPERGRRGRRRAIGIAGVLAFAAGGLGLAGRLRSPHAAGPPSREGAVGSALDPGAERSALAVNGRAERSEPGLDAGRGAPVEPGQTLAPATSILVLRLGAGSTQLVSWAEKPVRFLAPDLPTDVRGHYRLEDPVTGRLLLEGACDLPEPCRCAIGHDHAHGCGVVRHDAVVRLKLPRLASRERVVLLDGPARVGTFLLEAPS